MKTLYIIIYSFLILLAYVPIHGAVEFSKTNVQVHFGNCPKKPSGDFVFKSSKAFDENKYSLMKMKEFIKERRLKQKHFLKDYRVTYNPVKKSLSYFLECSPPILKVSALDEKGKIAYDIILSEDAQTHDPSYIVYLNNNGKPPILAKATLPSSLINRRNKEELVLLARKTQGLAHIDLREMIYADNNEMTMIVRRDKKIISVFLGRSFWEKKLEKLDKIMSYMDVKKRTPSQINLTDMEKIVIKF